MAADAGATLPRCDSASGSAFVHAELLIRRPGELDAAASGCGANSCRRLAGIPARQALVHRFEREVERNSTTPNENERARRAQTLGSAVNKVTTAFIVAIAGVPPRQQWDVGREFRKRLRKAMNRHGIAVPYPVHRPAG